MPRILTGLLLATLLGSGACGTPKESPPEARAQTAAELASLDLAGPYYIGSDEFGTETTVTLIADERRMRTNALPNHPTGAFPNPGNPNTISAQPHTYTFPREPRLTGESPRWARQPGIAVNGVKFEPGTAERFICESGEVYRIEAVQELVDLGLDHNHAHVQPTGHYHYHGVPTELVALLAPGKDLVRVGFAMDGFPIYYSRSGRYTPSYRVAEESRTGEACSYTTPRESIERELAGSEPDGTFVSDWIYVPGLGNLDECNGTTVDGAYAYFVTDDYPYVGRCLKGEFAEERRGPPPGGRRPPPDHRH